MTPQDVVESLRERIRELEGAIDDDKAQRFQEENKVHTHVEDHKQ